MKKPLKLSALVLLLAAAARAQSPSLPPGKIAVFKAGDNTGTYNISVSKVQPCFVQVYDTTTNNQAAPWVSVTLPTNAAQRHLDQRSCRFGRRRHFPHHQPPVPRAGGLHRQHPQSDAAKPSSDPTVTPRFGTLDAFGNEQVLYRPGQLVRHAAWSHQNNPTGIASTDGTNFWGTGNVTGTSSEAARNTFL